MTARAPRISILLVTYNHAKYVRTALKSVLRQRIEEPLELVVADDGSIDDTVRVVKEFDRRDSRFTFKYLDSSKNLGISANYQRGVAACTGEYVAVLEGDDYWIRSTKLQRQVDFLEEHWECDLCSSNHYWFDQDRAEFSLRTEAGPGHRLVTARSLIRSNIASNFSTCVYRKTAFDRLPDGFWKAGGYDWILNITLAMNGMIGYVNEPLSVYRIHKDGLWGGLRSMEKVNFLRAALPVYNELTGGTFTREFEQSVSQLQSDLETIESSPDVAPKPNRIRATFEVLDAYSPPLLLTVMRALYLGLVPRRFQRVLTERRESS